MRGEYSYYERVYGIKIAPKKTCKLLVDRQKLTSHPMTNEAWYDVLFNFDYVRAFCYVPSTIKDRITYIPCPKDNDEY